MDHTETQITYVFVSNFILFIRTHNIWTSILLNVIPKLTSTLGAFIKIKEKKYHIVGTFEKDHNSEC